jgi:hypothetical protein
VSHQKAKNVEDLRFEINRLAAPLHRDAAEVDVDVTEFTGSRFGHRAVSPEGRSIIGRTLNHDETITTRRAASRHAASIAEPHRAAGLLPVSFNPQEEP